MRSDGQEKGERESAPGMGIHKEVIVSNIDDDKGWRRRLGRRLDKRREILVE